MLPEGQSCYVETNGIRLHYIDHAGNGPEVVLMHGLTANAHAFDGLMEAGLAQYAHMLSVDLRGRGLSDQPDNYTMGEHARDIIGMLDVLGLEQVIVGGHSFGGLLSIYLAANYPERIKKIILLDAGGQMHPDTKDMLVPTLSRLGITFPSFSAYLDMVKSAPYNTFWDDAMMSYYKADITENADGSVTPRSKPEHIAAAAINVLSEAWVDYLSNIEKPAILINGPDNYAMDAPLLPAANAIEGARKMQHCKYVAVPGNHQTMLYGAGAKGIVAAIGDFLNGNQE